MGWKSRVGEREEDAQGSRAIGEAGGHPVLECEHVLHVQINTSFCKRLDQGFPWASWEEATGHLLSGNQGVPSLSQVLF